MSTIRPVNFSFVLQDFTTDVTPAAMRPAAVFQTMIDAWLEQSIQFGMAWGMPSVAFRIGQGPTDRQPLEIGINFRDLIPEAPGDLAYHQCVAGVPDIEIGVDLYSTLLSGARSVSVGGSHEFLETIGDPGANRWASKKDGLGMMAAFEMCDAVENTWYPASNGTALSNFLLPAYFIPQAFGQPFDHMGVLAAVTNDEIKKYGYEMQATAPGGTVEVHADVVMALNPGWVQRKMHPYSRATRRGWRKL